MKGNLRARFNNIRKLIDSNLDRYLPKESAAPKTLHRAMRYSVFSGGKRIRPILALEGCRACGANIKDAVPAACALELVHAYSLIHDDLPAMDDDDYRRGKPACHKKFGEAQGILAGDGLLTLAFNIISKELDKKIVPDIVRELSEAIGTKGMAGGQSLDIETRAKTADRKMVRQINFLKTAKLFEAAAKLGAICGRASKREIAAMARYGALAGEAFQIIDDILDGDIYSKPSERKKARLEAESLIKNAEAALKIFGNRADVFREIAQYMVNRQV